VNSENWTRWVTVLAVLVLAGIAAVVSYSHMHELALRHGEPEWRAALFPLSVDGMIVASSMTLLSDARHGHKGGLLPWTLLILGSGASLAANVAVADPTMWSRIIHAWPSFALIGAYELLMRAFRGHAQRGPEVAPEERAYERDEGSAEAAVPAAGRESGPLGEVSQRDADVPRVHGESDEEDGDPPPRVQVEAWRWTLDNRGEDGTFPTGKEIGRAFGRKERWGRLVKRRGEQGVLGSVPDAFDEDGTNMTAGQRN